MTLPCAQPTGDTPTATPWWENTKTWTTRSGETIRLEDMTAAHRTNLMRFGSQPSVANKIRRQKLLNAVIALGVHSDYVSVIDTGWEITQQQDEIDHLLNLSPESLWQETPLYQRLNELEQAAERS